MRRRRQQSAGNQVGSRRRTGKRARMWTNAEGGWARRSGTRGCVHQGLKAGPRHHLAHAPVATQPPHVHPVCTPGARLHHSARHTRGLVHRRQQRHRLVRPGKCRVPRRGGAGMGSWKLQDCLPRHKPSRRQGGLAGDGRGGNLLARPLDTPHATNPGRMGHATAPSTVCYLRP